MLNNFIYAKKKELFLEKLALGEVLDEAVVFIEDTKEIWNHGTFFGQSLSWRELDSLPTFMVSHIDGSVVEYTFEKDMTWGEFCDSDYNTDDWSADDYEVNTFLVQGESAWDYWESRWLVTNEGDWYDQETQPNATRKIIEGHVYYEVVDSGGLGGGGGF